MKELVGKFTFKVPDGHPEAGKKIEKSFDYKECENDTEAQSVMTEKKWNLKDLVNDSLKANARSSSYQAATLVYRPTEVSAEQLQERIVRDLIRGGLSEEQARNVVASTIGAQSQPTTE